MLPPQTCLCLFCSMISSLQLLHGALGLADSTHSTERTNLKWESLHKLRSAIRIPSQKITCFWRRIRSCFIRESSVSTCSIESNLMKFHGSHTYPFFSFFVAKTAQSLDAQSDHFDSKIVWGSQWRTTMDIFQLVKISLKATQIKKCNNLMLMKAIAKLFQYILPKEVDATLNFSSYGNSTSL